MTKIVIIGAGLAGLSSGWFLKQNNIDFIVLEKENFVGGLARSFKWQGFDCDFATHRLFSSDEKILQELLKIIPMGRHIRRSKIHLRGNWLRDPLDIFELLSRFSALDQLFLLSSYLFRDRNLPDQNFENYVIRRYGKGLYEFFFQPYTEKLFGIPGKSISPTWAEMKVRLASPLDLIRESTKTKFQYFYYPINGGYGAIANRLYEEIKENVILNANILNINTRGDRISEIKYKQEGRLHTQKVDLLISTIPLTVISKLIGFEISLQYRKVDSVYIHANKPQISDNHWIYFIDKDIAINRLVEFKNLSSYNTPQDTTVICSEVTQHYPDVLFKVITDLEKVNLLKQDEILNTMVIREDYSYPVYDLAYKEKVIFAKKELSKYKNLHILGRSAEFIHREADDNFWEASKLISKILPKAKKDIMEKEKAIGYFKSSHPGDPSVFIVILTWNNYPDTEECLDSIDNMDYGNYQIVLVDNGSTDNTPEKVKKKFPNVHIIKNEQNIGVPAGYNVGFSYALNNDAEYILMLNNDTIIHPKMLRSLLSIAQEDPQAGIIMPRILFHGSDDEIWSSGGRYRSFPPAILMTDNRKGADKLLRLIEYAPGCILLIHRQAFKLAGLFDPGYFFLYDDWDFSERVRAHGLNIWYVPEAHGWHKVSRSTKGPSSPLFWRTLASSSIRYYRRHGRPVWISLPIHIGHIILREFFWKGNWKYWKYYYEGLKAGFQQPLGNIPQFK